MLGKIYSLGTTSQEVADEVIQLSRSVAEELVLASIFPLVAVSNIAVDYLGKIFCNRCFDPKRGSLLQKDQKGCGRDFVAWW